MTLPPRKVLERIRALFAMLGGAEGEARTAREKLVALLAAHKLTWNDLPVLLAEATTGDDDKPPQPRPEPPEPPTVNVLALVFDLIGRHVAVTEDERRALALWVLHTWIYERFDNTPRLALLSPVNGCGKTTLLSLLRLLVRDPRIAANTTPAPLYYWLLHRPTTTWLLDEGDNLDMGSGVLRSVLNMGHTRGASIHRMMLGMPLEIPVFAPVAVAAIGTLPFPLLRRSVSINMQRPSADVHLERLDDTAPQWAEARDQIARWAAHCDLNLDPVLPPQLRDRPADNWRVLLSVADSLHDFGHDDVARATAVRLSANRLYTEPGIALLADIRDAFGSADRMGSDALIGKLRACDDENWNDWRGPKEDRPPHPLTVRELAEMLRPFQIRPRTIRVSAGTGRGYMRSQFKEAWERYCRADTATDGNVISLEARP